MTKDIFGDKDVLPCTLEQLLHFRHELLEAGGIYELMIQKEALEKKGNGKLRKKYILVKHEDIEGYKKKYLTGVYLSLQDHFKTKVPYVFWSKMYAMSVRFA